LPRSQPAPKAGASSAQEANSHLDEAAHMHRALM
jgi:hypothetical protein